MYAIQPRTATSREDKPGGNRNEMQMLCHAIGCSLVLYSERPDDGSYLSAGDTVSIFSVSPTG